MSQGLPSIYLVKLSKKNLISKRNGPCSERKTSTILQFVSTLHFIRLHLAIVSLQYGI